MIFYYNWGMKNGREYVAGPYTTEDDAHEKGFLAYDGGTFETYPLNTRDFSEAVRRIRHIRLEGGASIEDACRRKRRIPNEQVETQPTKFVEDLS